MNIRTRIINHLPKPSETMKQINFGTAVGLTNTAKEASKASIGAIKGSFITRGNWMEPSNRFGVRITPARKDKLVATVHSAANWLQHHEEGTNKQAQGGTVAVPTDQVRRNKRQIIPRGQRPRGLMAKAFVMKTKRGDVIAIRQGRGKVKALKVLYGLEPQVRIKKRSTFYEPIQKVVDRRLKANITAGIRRAFATMR